VFPKQSFLHPEFQIKEITCYIHIQLLLVNRNRKNIGVLETHYVGKKFRCGIGSITAAHAVVIGMEID